jgi:TolB-like protein
VSKGRKACRNRLAWAFCLSIVAIPLADAETSVTVLDFELKDLTLRPGDPEEKARTDSIRPLLERTLAETEGLEVVRIDSAAIRQANAGFGYLYEHPDIAAELAREHGADWVVIGRLHKPSFLFVYLMARLVDAHNGNITGDHVVELKGQQARITAKGVERLAEQLTRRIAQQAPR